MVLCNFTPVLREPYRIGVPAFGTYAEVFNTDAAEFGGTGVVNGTLETEPVSMHGFAQSLNLTVPPLSVLFFELKKEKPYPTGKKSGKLKTKPDPSEKPKASALSKGKTPPAAVRTDN